MIWKIDKLLLKTKYIVKQRIYKLSNDIYAAMIRKVFLSEFWFQWNMPKDLSISLKCCIKQLFNIRGYFLSEAWFWRNNLVYWIWHFYLACHFMTAFLDRKVLSAVILTLENYNLLHKDSIRMTEMFFFTFSL